MHERAALDVTAVRALETSDRAHGLWSDADRAWASRAAAEVVGEHAAPDAFLARRATLALERVGERAKAIPRAVRTLHWRPWVGVAVVVAAFVLGFALDRIGDGGRINVLAPPVLGLVAWNLAVYLVMGAGFVLRFGDAASPGPFKRALMRVAGGAVRPRGGDVAAAIGSLGVEWSKLAAPLYAARASRILHLAAAALALGVITGLYLRGLAFEYRASWASTFLSPQAVHDIVRAAYLVGSKATGIPIPDVASVEAIRAPAGENAARWLHLMAATVVVLVVLPRLALALWSGLVERHRATHVPLPLDEPYFRRLLRGYRGGPARVRVLPYSYTLTPDAARGLEALVARSFGGGAALHVAAPVTYGNESAAAPEPGTTTFVVFGAASTPEPELHGRFLAVHAGADTVALVDESALVAQGADPARLEARRTAWRDVCANAKVPIVFADLRAPDLAAAEAALDAALGEQA